MDNRSLRERIVALETQLINIQQGLLELDTQVRRIENNALPHLMEKLVNLEKQVALNNLRISIGAGIFATLFSELLRRVL